MADQKTPPAINNQHEPQPPSRVDPAGAATKSKAAREAEELRRNLLRRKAQQRQRQVQTDN
ncbi:MAG TPA: hypothetical protein VND94_19365 [Terriglobia bacterium]|nr:hypothetical protein [Terriglobia bacterium]